jgi:hypothetical protein
MNYNDNEPYMSAFQDCQARGSMYIVQYLHVESIWYRSRDVSAGTVGTPPQVPPQTLQRQAQRLSHVGGRMLR